MLKIFNRTHLKIKFLMILKLSIIYFSLIFGGHVYGQEDIIESIKSINRSDKQSFENNFKGQTLIGTGIFTQIEKFRNDWDIATIKSKKSDIYCITRDKFTLKKVFKIRRQKIAENRFTEVRGYENPTVEFEGEIFDVQEGNLILLDCNMRIVESEIIPRLEKNNIKIPTQTKNKIDISEVPDSIIEKIKSAAPKYDDFITVRYDKSMLRRIADINNDGKKDYIFSHCIQDMVGTFMTYCPVIAAISINDDFKIFYLGSEYSINERKNPPVIYDGEHTRQWKTDRLEIVDLHTSNFRVDCDKKIVSWKDVGNFQFSGKVRGNARQLRIIPWIKYQLHKQDSKTGMTSLLDGRRVSEYDAVLNQFKINCPDLNIDE
jgi:hypothetical protein